VLPFELRYGSALDVACIDGSVMDPLRTLGSNCVSIGGSVVRAGGGGESMNMGVGPVFIGEANLDCESFIGCPTMSASAYKTKHRGYSKKGENTFTSK
jgi:hypothetical protein